MGKSWIDRVVDSIFDDEWTGKRGEKLTAKELKLVNFFGRKGKILRNLYIPKDNEETAEIDVVYITQKGIFVFESKNYSGWIFGDEKSFYWMATLPNGIKNQFYNPVMQNRTHIKWLKQYLDEEIPMFSLIAFSERCELKKITIETPNVKVFNRDHLYANVRLLWDAAEDCLTDAQVKEIYQRLRPLTKISKEEKQQHIDQVKIKMEAREKKKAVKADIEALQTAFLVSESEEAENEIEEAEAENIENISNESAEMESIDVALTENPADGEAERIGNQVALDTLDIGVDFDIPEREEKLSLDDDSLKIESAEFFPEEENISTPSKEEKPLTLVSAEMSASAAEQNLTDKEQDAEIDSEDLEGKESTKICPRCGHEMILRTARKGANAGSQFWGCSNFPKCRMIINI